MCINEKKLGTKGQRNIRITRFPGWLKRTDLWFLVVRIRNLLPVIPVFWLFGFRVLNFSGRQEVPVILQIAGLDLLIVDLDLIGLIWIQNQCVKVSQLIVLEEREVFGSSHWCRGSACLHKCKKNIFKPYVKCQNYLALNLFLDEVILPLVIENDMDFLGAVATDVRACGK